MATNMNLAGMAGLSHTMEALTMASRVPLLHLAAMNPYVTAAMGPSGWEQAWSVARQAAAAPAPSASDPAAGICGTSAFAFQVRCNPWHHLQHQQELKWNMASTFQATALIVNDSSGV